MPLSGKPARFHFQISLSSALDRKSSFCSLNPTRRTMGRKKKTTNADKPSGANEAGNEADGEVQVADIAKEMEKVLEIDKSAEQKAKENSENDEEAAEGEDGAGEVPAAGAKKKRKRKKKKNAGGASPALATGDEMIPGIGTLIQGPVKEKINQAIRLLDDQGSATYGFPSGQSYPPTVPVKSLPSFRNGMFPVGLEMEYKDGSSRTGNEELRAAEMMKEEEWEDFRQAAEAHRQVCRL